MKAFFCSLIVASVLLTAPKTRAAPPVASVCFNIGLEALKCTLPDHDPVCHSTGENGPAQDVSIALEGFDDTFAMGEWSDAKALDHHVFHAFLNLFKLASEHGEVYSAHVAMWDEASQGHDVAGFISLGEGGSLTNGFSLQGPLMQEGDVVYAASVNIQPCH